MVPRGSLRMTKEKHRCYHEGKWGDREHPDSTPNPDWEFGIAYVTLEDANTRTNDAIKELNGKWYVPFQPPFSPFSTNKCKHSFANCVIQITRIPRIPDDFVVEC